MNGKKAKALRREAAALGCYNQPEADPRNTYKLDERQRCGHLLVYRAVGEPPIKVPKNRHGGTIVLGNCVRRIYQQLKKAV